MCSSPQVIRDDGGRSGRVRRCLVLYELQRPQARALVAAPREGKTTVAHRTEQHRARGAQVAPGHQDYHASQMRDNPGSYALAGRGSRTLARTALQDVELGTNLGCGADLAQPVDAQDRLCRYGDDAYVLQRQRSTRGEDVPTDGAGDTLRLRRCRRTEEHGQRGSPHRLRARRAWTTRGQDRQRNLARRLAISQRARPGRQARQCRQHRSDFRLRDPDARPRLHGGTEHRPHVSTRERPPRFGEARG